MLFFRVTVFTITQAQAETYHIQYSFNAPYDGELCYPDSGSIDTLQTYKTETAAEEL
jgi:hypothetical protein